MKQLFKKRKNNQTTPVESEQGDFIQSANYFINLDIERVRSINKILLGVSFFLLLTTFFAVLAVYYLTPLKTVEPIVVQVDKITGDTRVITTLPKITKSYDKVIDEHFLTNYIQFRESYDWFHINDFYNATILMSSQNVADKYKRIYGSNNANSLVNILKNDYKILVKINSIQYIGDTVQIRFTKVKTPVVEVEQMSSEQNQELSFIATVVFDYDKTKMMTNENRRINPLGFRVLSYEVAKEN
ncbi:MAG: type IV secretion system protein [Neisseriaceae bacterium]|nr:type IV secretion system protein [Neisseriaceae bacterium]